MKLKKNKVSVAFWERMFADSTSNSETVMGDKVILASSEMVTGSHSNHFWSLLLQPTDRRKKPKGFCKIKRKDDYVGWGCLVIDEPGETSHLTEYFIITSSKAIPKENFDAEEYEVKFKKRMVKITDIAKKVHHVLPEIVLIAIYPQSYVFNHPSCRQRKRCSVLKKSPKVHVAPCESPSQFFFIGDKYYDLWSKGSIGLKDGYNGCCSVLFELNNDSRVQVVGIVNLEDNGQRSTHLLPKSSLNTIILEHENQIREEEQRKRREEKGKLKAEEERKKKEEEERKRKEAGETKKKKEEEETRKEEEERKKNEEEEKKRKEEGERKKKEEEEKRMEEEERKKKEEEERKKKEKEEKKRKEEEEMKEKEEEIKRRKEEEERRRREEEERKSGERTGKFRKSEGHGEESEQVNDSEVDLVDAGRSRLLMSVKEIPLPVYSQVCLSLNVRRHVRSDDFRMLGEKVGLSRAEIEFVGQRKNPADEILKTWSSRPEATVAKLIELLKHKDFGRMDVVQIVEDWVYSKER